MGELFQKISTMPGAPVIEVLIIAGLIALFIFVIITEEKWS